MTVGDIFHAVRRSWLFVLLCTLIGALGMFGISKISTPTYTASARVFVSVAASRGASDLSQGATFVQSQVASYADLATSPYVLDPVAKRLGIAGGAKDLTGRVTGSSSKETVLIDIKATDPEAQRSSTIADAIADELGTAVRQLAPRDADGRPMVQVVTVSRSGPPSAPQSPKTSRNTLTGGASGLLIGVLAACLWGFYRSHGDKEPAGDVPAKGKISAITSEPPVPAPKHEKKSAWRQRKKNKQTPPDVDKVLQGKEDLSPKAGKTPAARTPVQTPRPASPPSTEEQPDEPDTRSEQSGKRTPPQTEQPKVAEQSSSAAKRAAHVSLPTQPMASTKPTVTRAAATPAEDDDPAQKPRADLFRIPAARRPSSKMPSTDEPTVYIPPVPRAVEPSALKDSEERSSTEGESRDG
ncbi:Wzz/FepE/Etk N-terminal domain-containing protein [Austwickia chelonae]|uniref:Wzz/FepE/Etk N-terminal domain-containing protein n=1 Tax=Austwickia chelonae TaxID=100225 RepID=UPI000E248B07|nr:Wzz/FepE/Etk N-terminal domain-containing protein [Austwickia chelonae]